MIEAAAVHALAVFGVTFVVTRGSIFEPVHEWLTLRQPFLAELVGCHVCLGFWLALAAALQHVRPTQLDDLPHVAILTGAALGGSVLAWAVHARLNC